MTEEEWNELLIPGSTAFKQQIKPEVEMPIRTEDLFTQDFWIDDNGVRHIVVREDMND